jgi:DNA-binding NtrC family response regulator
MARNPRTSRTNTVSSDEPPETADAEAGATSEPPIPTLQLLFSDGVGIIDEDRRPLSQGDYSIGRTTSSFYCLTTDPKVSRNHALIRYQAFGLRLIDGDGQGAQSRHGTFLNGRKISDAALHDGDIIRVGGSFLILRFVPTDLNDFEISTLFGRSPVMQQLRDDIRLLNTYAPDQTTLLIGETGTGKEVVARALHTGSPRVQQPYVTFDCAKVKSDLVLSELFGHARGAFTNAIAARKGQFELAHKGTLFIDELGELPRDLQTVLLRAVQERTVSALGDNKTVQVDVRIIAATNRDLFGESETGAFRSDLLGRLEQQFLRLPPLRERREDILLLLRTRLDDEASKLTPDLVERLLLARWSRNIRELFGMGDYLRVKGRERTRLDPSVLRDRPFEADVALQDAGEGDDSSAKLAPSSDVPEKPKEGKSGERPKPPGREQLVELLGKHQGNVYAIARLLGLERRQIYRLMERYGINLSRHRTHNARPPDSDTD